MTENNLVRIIKNKSNNLAIIEIIWKLVLTPMLPKCSSSHSAN